MGWPSFFGNFLSHFAMHFHYGVDKLRTATYTCIRADNDTLHSSFTSTAYSGRSRLGLLGLP